MHREPTLEDLLKNPNTSFEVLYSNYKEDFVAFARTFSLEEQPIVDIYQDTFLSFYENLLNGKLTSVHQFNKNLFI